MCMNFAQIAQFKKERDTRYTLWVCCFELGAGVVLVWMKGALHDCGGSWCIPGLQSPALNV